MPSFWAPRQHFWANISIFVKVWIFQLLSKITQKCLIFAVFFIENAFFFACFVLHSPECSRLVNGGFVKWSKECCGHLSTSRTFLDKHFDFCENLKFHGWLKNCSKMTLFCVVFLIFSVFRNLITHSREFSDFVPQKRNRQVFGFILSTSAPSLDTLNDFCSFLNFHIFSKFELLWEIA